MLEIAVLGSGSSGNSALIRQADTLVLVDAGLSARQLVVRMQALGVDPDSLSAIVLTHEHGDHVCGLDVFCRKRPLPVYATVHTCALLKEQTRSQPTWKIFETGGGFHIGSLHFQSFPVPHDAVDPVGYVVRHQDTRLGILSDVGHVTRLIVERLKGVDALFTEANYDESMLQNDTKRPWSLKQRISNRHGHLSNEQTMELVREIAGPNLTHVLLGHLSSDCNCPDLVSSLMRRHLSSLGLGHVVLECAKRHEATPFHRIRKVPELRPAPCLSATLTPTDETDPFFWQQTEWSF